MAVVSFKIKINNNNLKKNIYNGTGSISFHHQNLVHFFVFEAQGLYSFYLEAVQMLLIMHLLRL